MRTRSTHSQLGRAHVWNGVCVGCGGQRKRSESGRGSDLAPRGRATSDQRAEGGRSRGGPGRPLLLSPHGRQAMNWDQIQGSWKQFTGKLKSKWGKLTDDDLTLIGGKKDQLLGKLQERY